MKISTVILMSYNKKIKGRKMEKYKYATTMFSGITKRAYIKIEKEFYEFLDNAYNEHMHSVVTNDQFHVILVNLDRYEEFDRAENEPLTDQDVDYIRSLDMIVMEAREHGLNELELESE